MWLVRCVLGFVRLLCLIWLVYVVCGWCVDWCVVFWGLVIGNCGLFGWFVLRLWLICLFWFGYSVVVLDGWLLLWWWCWMCWLFENFFVCFGLVYRGWNLIVFFWNVMILVWNVFDCFWYCWIGCVVLLCLVVCWFSWLFVCCLVVVDGICWIVVWWCVGVWLVWYF